jgi:hypothetical protein
VLAAVAAVLMAEPLVLVAQAVAVTGLMTTRPQHQEPETRAAAVVVEAARLIRAALAATAAAVLSL